MNTNIAAPSGAIDSPALLRRDAEVVEVKRFVDEHGVVCVRVPLRVHRSAPFPVDSVAILEEADWDYLTGLTRGASPSLSLMLNGPREQRTKRRKVGRVQTWDTTTKANQHVSRIILKAGLGQVVRHSNGNILDLRRRNLIMEAGRATDREQRAIAKRRGKVANLEQSASPTLPKVVKRRKRESGVKAATRRPGYMTLKVPLSGNVESETPQAPPALRIAPLYAKVIRETLAQQRGVDQSAITDADVAAVLTPND